jgi:hypothetical protein
MSGVLTRWPVVQRHDLVENDFDDAGAVRPEVVDRLITAARCAYLELCAVVQELRAREQLEFAWQAEELARAVLSGRPESLIVSASVPEFRPSSFTVLVRVRPIGSDDEQPVNSRRAVRLEDPVTHEARKLGNGVRAELIELEQGAQYFN